MSNKVAIIGSFQKYYDEITKTIKFFRDNELWILSPKDSHITGRIEDFVIFESDNKLYTPEEIQMITLEKILSADAVYVFNPNGYIGRTTCYEIGFCLSRSMPLYFLSKPNDLPIPICEDQIVSPEKFVERMHSGKCDFVTEYKMCNVATQSFNNIMGISVEVSQAENKNIVICGSMKFYDEMLMCQQELEKLGISSIIPKEENDALTHYSAEDFRIFKKKVSSSYLRKIREKNTVAVLIYNQTKNGVENYIGANTLVELAMAFMWNRKIFLYNDIYEPLADELLAWDSVCLKGSLNKLVSYMKKESPTTNTESIPIQLSIFDE